MDRYLVALSLLGIFACSVPLISERAYVALFGSDQTVNVAPSIGKVNSSTNDIRYKDAGSLVWSKAEQTQSIHLGDSLFTGEKSHVDIQLKDGSKINLEQNSMMTFAKINEIDLPNLGAGTFRIAVHGKTQIAINGQLTQIDGDGAEVQIVLSEHKQASVKLLKGNAALYNAVGKVQNLALHEFVDIEAAKPVVLQAQKSSEKKGDLLRAFSPLNTNDPQANLLYIESVRDIYEKKNGVLVRRQVKPNFVVLETDLSWAKQQIDSALSFSGHIYGQLSASPKFELIGDTFQDSKPKFSKSYIGTNYYRLSVDGKSWTQPLFYNVKSEPLSIPAPKINLYPTAPKILDSPITLTFSPIVDSRLKGSIVEISENANFGESKSTPSVYTVNSDLSLVFSRATTLYLRTRGFDKNDQVTADSQVTIVSIEKPEPPEVPILTTKEFEIFEREPLSISWRSKSNRRTLVELNRKSNEKMWSVQTSENFTTLNNLGEGEYRLNLSGADEYGRVSAGHAIAKIKVLVRPPEPAPEQRLSDRNNSDGTGSSKLKMPETSLANFVNSGFSNSRISIEGAGMTAYSQDQLSQGKDAPLALSLGARVLHWNKYGGFEGSIRTKVVGVSSSPGGDFAPLFAEARYHFGLVAPINPLSKLHRAQVTLITGYEMYRNSVKGPFSPKYDLLKFGTSIAFPVSERWDSGGEFVYGYGLDRSTKYEVSGFVSYYLRRDWSLGVSYRVHLFQAGSDATAPYGVPYREGFGESYSVLRWIY
jgi:hypothetical protein